MMQNILKKEILKHLDKVSFMSEENDVCFLTQSDIDKAIEEAIKYVFDKAYDKA